MSLSSLQRVIYLNFCTCCLAVCMLYASSSIRTYNGGGQWAVA